MPICNQSQHGSLLIIELLASKSTYIEMHSKGRKLMCRNFSKNVNKLLNRKPNRSKAKKEYSIIPSTSP